MKAERLAMTCNDLQEDCAEAPAAKAARRRTIHIFIIKVKIIAVEIFQLPVFVFSPSDAKSRCRMASGLPGIPFTPAARCVLVKPVPRGRARARGRGGHEPSAFTFQKRGEKTPKQKH